MLAMAIGEEWLVTGVTGVTGLAPSPSSELLAAPAPVNNRSMWGDSIKHKTHRQGISVGALTCI